MFNLTHLCLRELPALINWVNPFQILLGSILQFQSNFKSIFCEKKRKILSDATFGSFWSDSVLYDGHARVQRGCWGRQGIRTDVRNFFSVLATNKCNDDNHVM